MPSTSASEYEHALDMLRRVAPHGPLTAGDDLVGVYVTRHVDLGAIGFDDPWVEIVILCEQDDGGMAACVLSTCVGPEVHREVVRAIPRMREGSGEEGLKLGEGRGCTTMLTENFGHALRAALLDALPLDVRTKRPKYRCDVDVHAMLATFSEMRIGPQAAMEAHDAHAADASLIVGRFAERFEPAAVAALLRDGTRLGLGAFPTETCLKDAMGMAWEVHAGAFDNGAPLGKALALHPTLPGTILDAWRTQGEAFLRGVAEGRTDASLALVLDGTDQVLPAKVVSAYRKVGAKALSAIERMAARFDMASRNALWIALDPLSEARVTDLPLLLLMTVGLLPRDWMPRTDEDRRRFVDLAPALATAVAWTDDGDGLDRLFNVGADWNDFAKRMAWASDGCAWQVAEDGLHDMAHAFADQILSPAIALVGAAVSRPQVERVANALLFDGRSLPRILEESTDWHRQAARMASEAGSLPGLQAVQRWPAGLPDHAVGDLSLTWLTDRLQLVAEGGGHEDAEGLHGLSHCVSGYARRCMAGPTRIASIKRTRDDGTRFRVSTLEVDVGAGPLPMVTQHLGRGNSMPSLGTTIFVEDYIERLRGDPTLVHADAFAPVRDVDGMTEVTGYDHEYPGNWERVRAAWDRHLPRRCRGLTASETATLVIAYVAHEEGRAKAGLPPASGWRWRRQAFHPGSVDVHAP